MSQRKVFIENYLYKTDTSIRRTLLLVPRGVRLKRFHCIINLYYRPSQCFTKQISSSVELPRPCSSHDRPPFFGLGFVQKRTRCLVPFPHVTVHCCHGSHSVYPPSTVVIRDKRLTFQMLDYSTLSRGSLIITVDMESTTTCITFVQK